MLWSAMPYGNAHILSAYIFLMIAVGTYGVVTSAVVKAYPSIRVLASSLAFSSASSGSNDTETFWRGFDLYHKFGLTIVDNGGTADNGTALDAAK